jgi:tryptophan synthase alpha chain
MGKILIPPGNDILNMRNRITELFERKNENILNVFYTAGFPELDSTVTVARSLAAAGADMIEIGIPFSDPVADGPTIQASNKVALDNGMTLPLILQQVRSIRAEGIEIPILLMGYLNPVMQYGVEKFVKDAAEAGVDGLIVPDLPVVEYEELYQDLFEKHNLCNTFLIAPTTSEARIRKIDAATKGFVYAVSASSTTGARQGFSQEQLNYFQRLKDMKLANPVLIGFGISNRDTFSKAASYGAGAIVGSAFVNRIRDSKDIASDIASFVSELKG